MNGRDVCFSEVQPTEDKENVDFEEDAKWSNLLSDTSDFEE